MRGKFITAIIIVLFTLLCCKKKTANENLSVFQILEKYPDSIKIGGITFNYGFKNQILAHANGVYDSIYIEEKFYRPNQYLFDSCFNFFPTPIYSVLEIKKWNRTYLKDYDTIVWEQINFLIEQNIDSLFKEHLRAVQSITGIDGKGKFLAYLPPKDFGISGGCDPQSMAFDMMYKIKDKEYLQRVIPHEIEHIIYENQMGNDPYYSTGIGVTIDEGLASYFEHKYLNIPSSKILGSEEETSWLLANERMIFEKLEPYLLKELDSACPLLYHFDRTPDCEPIITDTPTKLVEKNLGYFLGHRIVAQYEKTNGKESWKDAYKLSPREFYLKSGYKDFLMD
jgi:hypothetical protein